MTERDERLDDAIDKDDQRIEAGQRQDDEDPTGAHAGRSLLSAFVTNDLTPAFEQLQDRFYDRDRTLQVVRTLCDETRYEFTISIDRPDHSGTPVTFVLVGLIDRSGDIQWQLEHPAAGTQSIRSSTAEEICRGITEAYIQQLDQR